MHPFPVSAPMRFPPVRKRGSTLRLTVNGSGVAGGKFRRKADRRAFQEMPLSIQAEDVCNRNAARQLLFPFGFESDFRLGGIDQCQKAFRGKRDKAIVIAEDQVAGIYSGSTDRDGVIDASFFCADRAARVHVTTVDRKTVKARQVRGIPDGPVADNPRCPPTMQIAPKDVTDHGIACMTCGSDHQNLPLPYKGQRPQHGPEIGRFAVGSNRPRKQPGLCARWKQGADVSRDLAIWGKIHRDRYGNPAPPTQKIGRKMVKRNIGSPDRHRFSH